MLKECNNYFIFDIEQNDIIGRMIDAKEYGVSVFDWCNITIFKNRMYHKFCEWSVNDEN